MQEWLAVVSCSLPDKPNERYIDVAHENLVADHVCSTQKIMIGAALCGDLPPPTTICHAGQPCDSTVATYSALAKRLGVPHFGLDIPNRKDERSVRYVADELERMVAFLQEHTGRKLEERRLREVVEESNASRILNAKVNDLLKRSPSPLADPVNYLMLGAGMAECTEYYERILREAAESAACGTGAVEHERVRLAWLSTMLAFDPGLGGWLRDTYGAAIVTSMLGTDTTTPALDMSSRRAIMEALARDVLHAPMSRECWGSVEHWMDYAMAACRDWHVDAVVMTLHLGCKNIWGATKLFKDRLADDLGIPAVIVEADYCDGRTFTAASIRARLAEFFDTMLV
jgi:benzoyl-CoA reductase/2-hydroxyglutaryl-CoA dehydratase subunit BcrC/BadD/HgdB